MKILVMTNMGRSAEYPYSDVFVRKQVEGLRRLSGGDEVIDYFCMKRKITSLWGSLVKYGLVLLRFIPRIVKRYDVVHLHYGYPLLLFLYIYKVLRPNTRTVVTFHGSDVNRDMRVPTRRLFSALLRSVDHVVTVSEALRTKAEFAFGCRVGSVLAAGVDETVFWHMPSVEKRYDFIFVGRFISTKGLDRLLGAIEKLGDPDLRFCFVGSGPLLQEIEAVARRYRITLRMNATPEELRLLYNESRFLVLPSESEGLPVVIGEAFFCGTPVIATRVGGIPEQVIEGHNGFFVKELSVDAVATSMSDVLGLTAGEYNRLVRNAQQCRDRFSVESVCRRQLGIYRELLAAESRGGDGGNERSRVSGTDPLLRTSKDV